MPNKWNEVSLCPLIVYTNSGSNDVQRNQFWISAAQSVRHYAPPAAQDSHKGSFQLKKNQVMCQDKSSTRCRFCPRTSCMMSQNVFFQVAKCVRRKRSRVPAHGLAFIWKRVFQILVGETFKSLTSNSSSQLADKTSLLVSVSNKLKFVKNSKQRKMYRPTKISQV